MKKEIRILFVEDVPADAVLVDRELEKGGLKFRTRRVDSKDVYVRELLENPPDLILSDHGLPCFDGFVALEIAREQCPDVPFIFVTNSRGEEMAIKTFEKGATDYVLKSNLSQLVPAVQRGLREAEERLRLKQKEQALVESEERFRMLIDSVKDYAIYMLDPEGRVATWNEGAERLEGYTAKEILGRPFSLFFTPEEVQRKVPEESLRRAEAEGRVVNEGWRVRKDGSRFWTQGTISALCDESGKLRGFVKVAHDMTRQKETEKQIQRLNSQLESRVARRTSELEAANQELEAFSYSVSHDLRAPLRHIVGYVEILESEAAEKLDEASRGHLRTIAESATHMGHLIDALLAFSRMSRSEMRHETVSLARIVEEAREQLRPDAEGRDVEWRIEELPEVQGDPMMLRQAVFNLLSNALKYTGKRAKAVIEVGAKSGEREIVFFVRDNGVGFDMSYVDKLFGVFQRLHRAREFEGTGIGLANVRRIINRHGGRTWAESSRDAGATFYFSLPRRSTEAP